MFKKEKKNIGSVFRNTASEHSFLYNGLYVILLICLQSPIYSGSLAKGSVVPVLNQAPCHEDC
jgi:hypothetical protein